LAASSGVKKRPSRRRGEHTVGLYERLLREAAELPEDLNRERNERMNVYLRNLRRPVPEGGGYVTEEELEQERERYLTDVRKLRALLVNPPTGIAGGYWLAHLRRKYPTEHAHLRDIGGWSRAACLRRGRTANGPAIKSN
jgi:hypothetical protein